MSIREEIAKIEENFLKEIELIKEKAIQEIRNLEIDEQKALSWNPIKDIKDHIDGFIDIVDDALKKTGEIIEKEANKKVSEQVKKAVDEFAEKLPSEIGNLTEEAQKMRDKIKTIKEELEKLEQLFDINKLKQRVIEEAENLCEEYLRSKLTGFESFKIKGFPDVELNLTGESLTADVYIYFLFLEYSGSTPQNDYLVKVSGSLTQSITQLSVPTINADINYNPQGVENAIKEKIEAEKDALIQSVITTLFSDYIAVFNVLRKYLNI